MGQQVLGSDVAVWRYVWEHDFAEKRLAALLPQSPLRTKLGQRPSVIVRAQRIIKLSTFVEYLLLR